MTDDRAAFREIKGIGPAFETELHEAGVRTWSSLAKVLDALAHADRVTGDELRALRDDARERASEDHEASDAAPAEPEDAPADAPDAATADERPTAAEHGRDATVDGGGSRTHTVALDGGPFIGGHGHDVEVRFATADVDVRELDYEVELQARAYGDPTGPWTTLGHRTGHCAPPEQPALHFRDAALAPGVYRTRVELMVTLPEPTTTAPAIALV